MSKARLVITAVVVRGGASRRWQADFTHWWIAGGVHTEILTWLDDHSRYALSVTAHNRVTGPIILDTSAKPMPPMAFQHPH